MRGWRKGRKKAEPVDAAVADEPPVALLIDAPADESEEDPGAAAEPSVEPAPEPSVELVSVAGQLAVQSEVLRLLEVVTSMCDHVIEFIENDRAERRLMLETLAHIGRMITDGTIVEPSAPVEPATATLIDTNGGREARERVIGGSMPAGPEPVIDLREPTPDSVAASSAPTTVAELESDPEPEPKPAPTATTTTEIAVEVRGRFGDRWVNGFEICEVMTTPDGPRYRLRRHRDGVVLPELFDATSIRHVETFEELGGDQLNGSTGYWSRS